MSTRLYSLPAALLLAAAALSAQDPAASGSTLVTVLTGSGVESFRVTGLAAPEAAAMRLNDDLADKSGRVPAPTPGYVLEAGVIVETGDPATLAALVEDLGGAVEPVDGSPGFHLVRTADVAAAIEATQVLSAIYPAGAVYLDVNRPKSLRRRPNDPRFNTQWHLHNTQIAHADANVEPAWDAGYTGQGVIVGVLEGGWETGHSDLAANYNSTASQNGGSSCHGTAVAGVIGAVAYNGTGVSGSAYDAEISKQYFGGSTTTANAFGYRNDLNDIKNNSWGPADNGQRHNISSVELNALRNATASGRGGLGEIFAWAAGNGGVDDRVEYDPYASSRHTLAIGAIGDQDSRSSYNERGSSMLAVAHSSGNNRGIGTTDCGNSYTTGFGGTSSASPLGAGVVALMLDANPSLTWRDVQGVLAHSSRKNDPGNANWLVNGAGLDINYDYGFGAVDAGAATAMAASWIPYGPEVVDDSGTLAVGQTIPDDDPAGINQFFTVSQSLRIETIEVIINVTHNNVGDLFIKLTSPSGTGSVLAKVRSDGSNNYTNYILTSYRHWDEDAQGTWELHISDRDAGTTGTWADWQLKVYGNDGSGGPGMTLQATPLYVNTSAEFQVTNGDPNAQTFLAYSLRPGSTFVPQLGVTLDMQGPKQIGAAVAATASGEAAWSVPIPASGMGRTVLVQSAQPGRVSNLLSVFVN